MSGEVRYEVEPYSYGEMREIAEQLELPEPVATALVRRGYRTAEDARRFLAADEAHPATAFEGIATVVELIDSAVAAGRRITVHGDYDVDGICSTAILVAALHRRGAECEWLIPSRIDDGYGLAPATIDRLVERGTELLVTVDCGITSVEEVALARAAGIEVIVTDHHQPAEQLPDCPIVHPGVCGYPFEQLCGAAVVWKLVEALEGAPPEADLDLVALATVADLVPLVGENRTLARLGLAELRRGRRPGLAALIEDAGVPIEHLDEGDIAFRLAPRLNAAGRMYRADAGVELMLSDDRERARTIAAELSAANRERRETERGVLAEAERAVRELDADDRAAPSIVVAGEGWHPGVIGIVASRLTERYGKPTVLIAIDADGKGTGSGRSIPGFDLLAALRACADHLDRYGGHRAAAGLEVAAARIPELRRDFAAATAAALPDGPQPARERIDAVVGTEALDIEVAEQLGRLGPFGQGNPDVRFLVPWARVGDVRPMGEEGRHARFSLKAGSRPARGVAFNSKRMLEGAELESRDLTVKLELNHWNGGVEPRAVLSGAYGIPASSAGGAAPTAEADGGAAPCGCGRTLDQGWWERFDRELATSIAPAEPAASDPGSAAGSAAGDPSAAATSAGAARRRVGAHGRSAVALVAELLSSGARVLVVAADARRRSELASLAASPARFGAIHQVVCGDCPDGELEAAAARSATLVLADWEALARAPESVARFEHVIAVDPPRRGGERALVERMGEGFLHEAWGAGGDQLAEGCWDRSWEMRAEMAEIFRAAQGGEGVEAILGGAARYRRSAELAARCVRVLEQLGLARLEGEGPARTLRVVSSERTDLERSEAYRAYLAHHREGRKFLQTQRANS